VTHPLVACFFGGYADSEVNFDFFKLFIDNVEVYSDSGRLTVDKRALLGHYQSVTSGTHEYKWTYSKDGSGDSGADSGFLSYFYEPSFTSAGGISITLDSGSYSLTGTDIILVDPPADETIVINSGSYALTGTNVNLITDYRETALAGSYNYTGTDIVLIDPATPETIVISPGVYTLTGTNLGLITGFKTQIDTGSYSITGTEINFAITRGMTIVSGSYILQGTNIDFSNTGNIWTDKPSVVTLWGDKTPVTTNWTDK